VCVCVCVLCMYVCMYVCVVNLSVSGLAGFFTTAKKYSIFHCFYITIIIFSRFKSSTSSLEAKDGLLSSSIFTYGDKKARSGLDS
jgi:hypothetical protein